MAKGLDKSFKCFEIQTQMEYVDRIKVETPNGVLTGREALDYNLEHNENVVSVYGGKHYLDFKKVVDGELVEPHIHYYVKLKDSRKGSTILGYINGFTVSEKTYIAPDLNNPDSIPIGIGQLETIHSSFSKCYEYLLHKDEKSLANPLKHEYTEEEVEIKFIGTDRESVKADTEEMKRSEKYTNPVEDFISEYGERIEKGEITRAILEKDKSIVPLHDYCKYKTYFERALVRQERINLARVNKDGMNMDVVYCYGEAGTGKTTYAKELCNSKGYDYFVSGSSNDPFDGYLGEEAIILDDLRGSCFAFADLLKILDNNTRSQVKSRYFNKVVTCKLIVITSIMNIDKLYSMFNDDVNKEPLEQLKRRCKCVMQFDMDNIRSYVWNKEKRMYDYVVTIPNTYSKKYDVDSMTEDEKIDLASEFLMKTSESIKEIVKYAKENKEVVKDFGKEDPDGFVNGNIEDNPFL